jgi:4-hydroxyphenylpyruvate dioxygenase
MRSTVLENPARSVKFPIVEPADGRRRSQVEDFVVHHQGAGVQHLALLCEDIVSAVQWLSSKGIGFLKVPPAYYEGLSARFEEMNGRIELLRAHGILFDRDDSGDLLQTFTTPIGERPTLFLELVERRGAKGFGSRNIRALFEAVEREQAMRAGW